MIHSRTLRRACAVALASAATLLVGVGGVGGLALAIGPPRAEAGYTCPPKRECHFVHVSTKGAPSWQIHGKAWIPDTNKVLYEWKEDHGYGGHGKVAGHVSWWWNYDPNWPSVANVVVDIRIISQSASGKDSISVSVAANENHCFSIDDWGRIRDQGNGIYCTDS